jgi:hypothetical protein
MKPGEKGDKRMKERKKKATEQFKHGIHCQDTGSMKSHQVPAPYWTPPMQRRTNESEPGGRGGQVTTASLIRKKKRAVGLEDLQIVFDWLVS